MDPEPLTVAEKIGELVNPDVCPMLHPANDARCTFPPHVGAHSWQPEAWPEYHLSEEDE